MNIYLLFCVDCCFTIKTIRRNKTKRLSGPQITPHKHEIKRELLPVYFEGKLKKDKDILVIPFKTIFVLLILVST